MDRFDLEQKIFSCWSVCEDLDVLAKHPHLTEQVRDYVLALKTIYHARFEDCFNLFEQMTMDKKIL